MFLCQVCCQHISGLICHLFINVFKVYYIPLLLSQAPCYKKRGLNQRISKVFSSLWHSETKALGFYFLESSSLGSLLSLPTSVPWGQDLTIYCMNSLLACVPDVIAGKTRGKGKGSQAYGRKEWSHGIMEFPRLTQYWPPGGHGIANKSSLLVRTGSGTRRQWLFRRPRASVPVAVKHWALPSTRFPVNSSSIPFSLMFSI